MKNILLTIVMILGLLTISNQSWAHPRGTDSILDQNIVSIDLKNDINIPPNYKQVELVRVGRSYCVMNMVESVGFDRSLKAASLNVISVERLTEETSWDNGFGYNFKDDYVIFKISSKKNPRQLHPAIKNILCGYDVTDRGSPLTITDDGYAIGYKRFEIPTFDQLNSFASELMIFQHGETIDITNQ